MKIHKISISANILILSGKMATEVGLENDVKMKKQLKFQNSSAYYKDGIVQNFDKNQLILIRQKIGI